MSSEFEHRLNHWPPIAHAEDKKAEQRHPEHRQPECQRAIHLVNESFVSVVKTSSAHCDGSVRDETTADKRRDEAKAFFGCP
jgi:hypothetical protein